MTSGFGFAAAADKIEAAMTSALSLRAVPLRPDLAEATGAWKGDPVHIASAAWTGPDVRFARVVRLTSPALDIANLLALPRPPSAAPVFGADLVAARPDTGLIAADLSPVDAAPRLASDPQFPDWATGVFSASPLFRRVTPDEASIAVADVAAMADRFVAAVRSGNALTEAAVDAAHRRYLAAHRRDDKMLTMLARIFGDAWTADFVDAVLFPPVS